MRTILTLGLILTTIFATTALRAEKFTIAGFTFDDSNAVKTASITPEVGNLRTLKTRGNQFAKYSESYQRDSSVVTNDFAKFDRSKSIGRIMAESGGTRTSDRARHVLLPDLNDAPPRPNSGRVELEVSWAGDVLRNLPDNDFVVYEAGTWEGFAVSVLKSGSTEWSAPRYQFADSYDSTHNVHAVAFDLSNFGIANNESISSIRISNLFNGKASAGADRVDNELGQGTVVRAKDPKYDHAYLLRTGPGSEEFNTDLLDADIVYIVALRDTEMKN